MVLTPKCMGLSVHLLLLHQLRIWAVIHDISPKHRCRERTIHLLRVDIPQLPVQDEIIALRSQAHRRLLAQQDEREDIAVLFSATEEELEWIDAIRDCVADEWHPVEDKRRFIGILRELLPYHVYENRECDKGAKCNSCYLPDACAR